MKVKFLQTTILYLLIIILAGGLYIDSAIDDLTGAPSSKVTFVYGAF